ncbi:Anp1-domain-containing protein [Aspergillus niger CBS 101883]|uniref:Anp1-domain-containing protein n=1 Tax=Aspergillus niger ATCC 13496 TaxID=1353008 RepID=A0A370C8Y2_ASPNG|nr:Anp1-domain-containing protein [Aspergillus niger CBS 101883]PYH55277.1 Anp1-domain-containing protein [Aspergillus niger CBS 101883]RDH22222.1 Anp1-domain-containing protein [Aspergillus niger ATCC 13496]
MGTPLVGTAIITGANGLLGSEIAVSIAKAQPFVHLLLVARDIRSDSVKDVTDRIRLIGPRSVEVVKADLACFNSVVSFSQYTVERVRSKEIPPVILLINSAATSSYVTDQVTRDGYDPVYQTNCIAPFLLTVSLLEAFRAGDGTPNGGARVINIGCSSMSKGSLDYFDSEDPESAAQPPGTPIGAKEATSRFGSSKLLMSAAMYALRRSLVLTGNISLNVYTMDPGGMTGESHLTTDAPLSVRMAHQTRSGLRPFLRVFSKSTINKASVPAKVIARVAFQKETVENWGRERYYILDSEYEAASVIPALRDVPRMDGLLQKLLQRLCLIAAISTLLLILIFPSFRALFLPAVSLGLVSSAEDLQLETVRYYDLSKMQGSGSGWEHGERVLMCTPLRDAASHLPMFFSHLRNLTYPHNLIDLAFLVSDSEDNTMEMLSSMLDDLQNDADPKMSFGEISVIQKDFGQQVQQDVESRHGFAAQASRRKLMAQARNWLLSATLRPTHSWVYWRDADVLTAPTTILEDLMRHDKDVIVPNVWRPLPDWLGGEQPYDLNSWQESETALALAETLDEDAVIVEGYAEYATWRPHLAYLRDPYGDPDMEMELDGVGGVSILAKARVFRAGVHFPAFSFEKHAETEGFGKMARRMGFSVIGLPHYTIWHLYEPSVDDLQHMEEMEQERLEREREEQEQAERAERVQSLFKDAKSQWDVDSANLQDAIDKEGKSQASDYSSSSSDVDSTKGSEEGPVAQPAAKEQEEPTNERKQAKQ